MPRMCAVATLAIIAPVSAQQQPARQPASVQTQGKPKDNGGEITGIISIWTAKRRCSSLPATANIKPALADTDADGDLDLYFGTEDGTVAYAENIGTAKEPDFEMRERYLHYLTPDEGVNPYRQTNLPHPLFTITTNDGDHDLFVADAKGQIYLYQNTGTPKTPCSCWYPRSFIKMDFSAEPVIAFTDINGDSLNDLVYGTQDGTLALHSQHRYVPKS
ncbi:hypothetical protein CHS0354_018410 [Potamilus streckersoni]|uniref:VCBS repeat-containing protein n=1 Tax=Potamilus streckersoni TaxID=2493646 RepID=A0AAE0TAK9_9BIVA|nr:hypothetical protein CHS0354_018410 [Potamilus streckersoni]